jgi:hypothetical protein
MQSRVLDHVSGTRRVTPMASLSHTAQIGDKMPAMPARRFALLLVLYFALDFANPLMPGAVQFVDGSVDVVHADRTRPESVPVDTALTSLPVHEQPNVLVRDPLHFDSISPDRRDHFVPVRRPPHAPSDPSSSSEDH